MYVLLLLRSVERIHTEWGGLAGLADALCTDLRGGISDTPDGTALHTRIHHFGINVHREAPQRPLLWYVWEALLDPTLLILIAAAAVSLVFGLVFFPPGQLEWLDSVGIGFAVVLVVCVTAANNWSKERKFRQLNAAKGDRTVRTVRSSEGADGSIVAHQRIVSARDVAVGDVLHMEAGDAVPADGILIFAAHDAAGPAITTSATTTMSVQVLVDESSLTGESDNVRCNAASPFLLAGTRVVDGMCTMLVLAVGEATEWGQTMATVATQEQEDTPLQKKLASLARLIGYVGITVAVLNFVALTIKYLAVSLLYTQQGGDGDNVGFSIGALLDNLLNYLIVAITIVVVGACGTCPLAFLH